MVAWFVIGVILAGSLLVLLNWWASADVKSARNALLWAIVGLCGLFGLVLLAAGKGFMAVIPAAFAAWRMAGRAGWDRIRGAGQTGDSRARSGNAGGMSREEAFDALGLREGASDEQVRAAYRKLMAQCHPDKGGNDYLAAKLNEAKRVLLGK